MDQFMLWDQACEIMRAEMTNITFNTWIKAALRPLDMQGEEFFIEAVTDFYHQYVVPRYSVLITNALSQAAGRPMKAQILTPVQVVEYKNGVTPEKTAEPHESLNPKYTFDTFVVGNNNRFAHATALVVAECQLLCA